MISFWSWNAETLTAIGTVGATIVALLIAVIGAFWNIIKNWLLCRYERRGFPFKH